MYCLHQLLTGDLAADLHPRLAGRQVDLRPVNTVEPLQGPPHAARSDIAHHPIHRQEQ